MQTALQVFRKDIREGTTHRLLKSAVLSALKGKGEVEKWFDDGRADVLADNTVFECLTNPNGRTIKEKIEKYTSKEMVFVVPETVNKRIFARFKCTVWFIKLKTGEVAMKETFTASYEEDIKSQVDQEDVPVFFRMKRWDVEDMKKVSEIIGGAYKLKKSTPSYVIRWILLKIAKDATDGDYKKIWNEIKQKGMEYVNKKQGKSVLTCPHYTLASKLFPSTSLAATSTAMELGD